MAPTAWTRASGRTTPWQESLHWAQDHVERASPNDRFSILIARQPPTFVREDFSREVDSNIAHKPDGNPDMPRSLADAWQHLQTRSKASKKEMIVVTDGQRHGWADTETLSALENLGNQWHDERERSKDEGQTVPSLRVVKIGNELPKALPNYALAPLIASRSVAKVGQKITVRSALRLDNFPKYQPPKKVAVSINGVETQQLALPDNIDVKQGSVLVFLHRFEKAGRQTPRRIEAEICLCRQ